MLAIVNGGPSDHYIQKRGLGVHYSIIIGVKYTATEFIDHCKPGAGRWHMGDLPGRYTFLFLLILCFTFTQLSDGFFL